MVDTFLTYHMGPLPEIPPAVNQLRLEKRHRCSPYQAGYIQVLAAIEAAL